MPSPDGQYDLVVLRGDKAAFDDFTYSLYIFPHNLTPPDRTKGSRVWLTQIWRGTTYLVYSGYDYPMFRWTGDRSIEIDLDELYYSPFQLDPVKWLGDPKKPVLVSLLFETKNIGNSMP